MGTLEPLASLTQSQPSYQDHHICMYNMDTLTLIRLLELVEEAGPVWQLRIVL